MGGVVVALILIATDCVVGVPLLNAGSGGSAVGTVSAVSPVGVVPADVPPLSTGGADPLSPADSGLHPSMGVGDVRKGGFDHPGLQPDAVLAQERALADGLVVKGFDSSTSVEDTSQRSAFTTVYTNGDGTATAKISSVPVNYQLTDGSWAKIDSRLLPVDGRPGEFAARQNSFSVYVGAKGVTITTPKGREVSVSPLIGATELRVPAISADGLSVTYPDVWPDVDVRFQLSSSDVRKELVIKGPNAPGLLALSISGVSVVQEPISGSLSLAGGAADEMTIGSVELLDALGAPVATDKAVAVDVAPTTVDATVGSELTFRVDPKWLASLPKASFPVVVDPSLGFGRMSGYSGAWARDSFGTEFDCVGHVAPNLNCPNLRIGNASTTGLYRWRSVFAYNYSSLLPTSQWDSVLYSATLDLSLVAGTSTGYWIAARRASDYGWCGVFLNFPACSGDNFDNVTIDNVTTGASFNIKSILLPWWTQGAPNVGWAFNGREESALYTYKEFASTLTLTYDRTARVTSMSPSTGWTQHDGSAGMTLAATAVADPDSLQTYYRFWLCQNPSLSNCNLAPHGDSGWTTTNPNSLSYAPGPGLTGWFYNKQLYWMVQTTGVPNPGSQDLVLSSGWNSWRAYNQSISSVSGLVPSAPFEWSPPATVILSAQGQSDPDGDSLSYRFVVRERGAVGVATKSDWLAVTTGNPVAWTIPADAPLTPGLIYEWTVEWQDYIAWFYGNAYQGEPQGSNNQTISSRFQQRLGSSGPSPMQTVGPVSLNLANGNMYTSVSTVGQSTASGSLGATLEYNSIRHDTGLRGVYSFGSFSMERIDPTINFNWVTAGPTPTFPVDFNATWTGWITVPHLASMPATNQWQFGAAGDDNVNVTVNGVAALAQTCCVGAAAVANNSSYFGASNQVLISPNGLPQSIGTWNPVSLTEGTPVPITVSFSDTGGNGLITLYYRDATGAVGVVPSDWLSPDQRLLPAGWSLDSAAAQDAEYVSARVESDQVVLQRADGDAISYERAPSGNGFVAPAGESDHVVVLDAAGAAPGDGPGGVQVTAADGAVYRFRTTGQLNDYTPAADAGLQTVPTVTWATIPGSSAQRLTTQTDPVSGKALAYTYYGSIGGTCPDLSAQGFLAPTEPKLKGILCLITRTDGQASRLSYKFDAASNVRLSRIENPGGQIADLGWTGSKLATIRTPFLSDLVTAAKTASTNTWTIGYDSNGRVNAMTAPTASSGATTNEGVTVNWYSQFETTVKVNNLDAIHGTSAWDRRTTFDGSARTTGDWSARFNTVDGSTTNSLETTQIWDPTSTADLLLAATNHGRVTTNIYDTHQWLTDVYGPSTASSCFSTTVRTPTGSCLTTVPHTHTDYDTTLAAGGAQTAMIGLAQTSWSNTAFSGSPKSESTFNPGASFAQGWSGTTGPPGITTDTWSTQFTGDINIDTAGTWGFWITTQDATDTASLYVDDKPAIVLRAGDPSGPNFVSYGALADQLTIGKHRIRIQYVDNGANAYIQVNWNHPTTGNAVVPMTALAPRYGLATRTTVDDTTSAPPTVTHTRFDENGWDPAYGLATSSIVDPAGAALKTSTTYDSTLRRRTSRSLPGGNTTTYAYYGNTEASPAITCSDGTNIAAGVNQGGLLKTSTSPTPASGSAVVYESVYDALGRVVATRTGTDNWACTKYDSRGRVTRVAYPSNATAPARNVDTTYSDTIDPQTVTVTDTAGTITTKTDFLQRILEQTDVWGANTKVTTVYDNAGRASRRYGATIGATGTSQGLEYTYERGGLVSQVKLDSQPIATPTYTNGTFGGEPASVSYPSGTGNAGNGTQGTIAMGQTGAITGLTWNQNGGALLTSDTVTRSQSGRVLTDTVDGAGTPAWTYTFDAAGRLSNAVGSGHNYVYGYAPTGGCGANTAAGTNTNRTSLIDNSATVASYCYDNADRLTSTTQPGYTGSIAYDTHGNTAQVAGQTLTYDYTNRHIGTYLPNVTSPTTSVVYQRNANDSLVSRTATVTTTTGGSTPAFRAAASAATSSGGGATTLAVNRPAGTVTGDALIAAVTIRTGTATAVTPPTGWTQIADSVAGTNVRTLTYWRTAAAGDPASWTWTLATAWPMAAGIVAYSGVNTTTPVDATAIDNHTTTTTTHTAPSVTTTVAGDLHLVVVGGDNRTTTTPPATMTERVDTTTGSNNGAVVHISDRLQATTGATGTAVVTSADAVRAAMTTITLKAAGGNTTTVTTVRYSFGAVLDTSNNVIERTVPLPGGVAVTKRTTGDVWSYPNIHGDIQAVANTAGAKQGSTYTYDPYGQPLTGVVDNKAGNIDNAWLGQHARPYEHETGLAPLIEMGARGYSPSLGRFLEVDPVEGGCGNSYVYVSDPVDDSDLNGLKCPGWLQSAVGTLGYGTYVRTLRRAASGKTDAIPKAAQARVTQEVTNFGVRTVFKSIFSAFSKTAGKAGSLASRYTAVVGVVSTVVDGLCNLPPDKSPKRPPQFDTKVYSDAGYTGYSGGSSVSVFMDAGGVPPAP